MCVKVYIYIFIYYCEEKNFVQLKRNWVTNTRVNERKKGCTDSSARTKVKKKFVSRYEKLLHNEYNVTEGEITFGYFLFSYLYVLLVQEQSRLIRYFYHLLHFVFSIFPISPFFLFLFH